MNKFNQLGKLKYNQLGNIKYNTEYKTAGLRQLKSRLGARPIILDGDKEPLAILENCIEAVLDQEVKALDELTFSIPLKDKKRAYIEPEVFVQMFETIYVIRQVKDRRVSSETEVFAEALWYDLQYTEPWKIKDWVEKTADVMMKDILAGSGWTVGTVEITTKQTLHLDANESSALNALRQLEDIFGGELEFDTVNQIVHLRVQVGKDSGAGIMFGKNMEDIEATYDTRSMITKIYPYGDNNMSIKDANSGVEYLENYDYYDNLGRAQVKKVQTIQDSRYKNPFTLMEMAQKALNILAKPQASYIIKLAVLFQKTKLTHEDFWLGDTVRVYDKDMKLDFYPRVLKWNYNIITPEDTEITLETVPKTLSDLLTGLDGFEEFSSADAIEAGDMLEMSVFNLLQNSRADFEYSSWTNSGWEIDPLTGESGNSSFKADGTLGVTKTLAQTVFPSNRAAYSISFRAAVENLVKGANGKVGIELKMKYADGTEGVEFIELT